MVGRTKKAKICEKVSHEEDRISQLPDDLICDNILCHLSTKDAVRTSVLSTRWRNLWRWVPGLDLDPFTFRNVDALSYKSFVERFFDSHRESWIRKLRLHFDYDDGMCDLNSWIIDAVAMRRIQHLDVNGYWSDKTEIPLSLYTCETLVHLQLCDVICNAEFVSLPCLKIMHLEGNRYLNETTLQNLISGSPVLEDLTISESWSDHKAIQVRSHTLKRIDIDESVEVTIDAPLLQCLRTKIHLTKNFKIINFGFSTKLAIDVAFNNVTYGKSVIDDILTDISRVRDLFIGSYVWKEIFLYSKSEPVLQFRDLSRLSAEFSKSDIRMLPTVLESCTKLESLILEMVKNESMQRHEEKREPNVMFSAVPRCLVSSLKFVELKRSIPRYEGEMELIRYFLKNSTVLEKLRLDTQKRQSVPSLQNSLQ